MLKPFTAEGRFECGFNEITEGKRCAVFAVRQEHGIGLGLAVAEEPGYHTIPLHWCNGDDFEQVSAHADELNRELFGLEPKVAGLIVASTIRPPSATAEIAVKPEAANAPAWTRMVFLEACATNEYEGPLYARLEVTPDFISSLRKLRALCSEHGLSQARVTAAPQEWGPPGIEDGMRLEAPELVVTSHLFWFTDVPKHLPFHIETAFEVIDRFIDIVSGPGEPIYLGVDPEELADENDPES